METEAIHVKILVVDDEPELLEQVAALLTEVGYEVITAVNGEVGLGHAHGQKPNLILLDVMMPGMDGYQVLKKLRADPHTQKIPVIMLTAKGETQDLIRSASLKANDHLIKPFLAEELVKAVRKNLFLV